MKNSIVVAIALSFIMVSCSQNAKSRDEIRESIITDNSGTSAQQAALYKAPVDYLADRKVIKTGKIAFTVDDIDSTDTFIKNIASRYGAYLSQESIEEWYGNNHHIIELKIPAENFDALLQAVSSNAGTLDKKDISTEDVTEEYIDVSARVKSMQELETRYFELLKQCKTVEEMLNIEKELATVRENIETAQGRLNYIDKRSAYSSLRIEFYLPAPDVKNAKPAFFSQLGKSFSYGWNGILACLVSLAAIWPLMVLLIFVFYLIRRSMYFRLHK